MITPILTAVLVGYSQVGPEQCQVDFLVENPSGNYYVITETERCSIIEQAMPLLK